MTLQEVQDQIIEEFSEFEEWLDKYEYLIELGNSLETLDSKYKTTEYLINGCQSRVWLHPELKNDLVIFTADSDAIITRGIVALLIRVLSGRDPKEIANAELYFIDKIGLTQNLSPTRSNGLLAMVKQIKMYGMAYYAKLNK
jgi:cysteine desulfuration protein SufE